MITINLMDRKLLRVLRCRRYRERHPERCGVSDRLYRITHPDKSHAQTTKWAKMNPDKVKAIRLRWSNSVNGKISSIAKCHKRRARKCGNGGSWTAAEWLTLKRQYGYRCVSCWDTENEMLASGRKLVPDHIIPIVKGGMNIIENLQPLCHGTEGCNNRKGAKYIDFVIS